MQTFKVKNFIKSTPKNQNYECVICNYIPLRPYTCQGPCHQNFCQECYNCIKANKNECPFRCSNPFSAVKGEPLQIEFICPFSPDKCQLLIGSLDQFYIHSSYCKFVPQNWKEKELNFTKYRCQQGHDLFFLDEKDLINLYGFKFYQTAIESKCCQCQEKSLCRSICPQCSQKNNLALYCINCRKPPCTKQTCLYEHPFVKRQNYSSPSLFCDFCGIPAYRLGPYAYRDITCNFDICESCFTKLPEHHELVPFKMSKNVIAHLIPQFNQSPQNSSDQEYQQPPLPAQNNVIDDNSQEDVMENEELAHILNQNDPLHLNLLDNSSESDSQDF